jgi:hypothetical protein
MQPPVEVDDETGEKIVNEPLPLPTADEAKTLRDVACHVCGIDGDECNGSRSGSGESRL